VGVFLRAGYPCRRWAFSFERGTLEGRAFSHERGTPVGGGRFLMSGVPLYTVVGGGRFLMSGVPLQGLGIFL